MKFDLVVGNPPYQKMDGGGGKETSSIPLYDKFIFKALELGPKYILFIIPSRWMAGGKVILNKLRNGLVESKMVSKIYNFENSIDLFDNVVIAGGVQYLLIDTTSRHNNTDFYNCKKKDNMSITDKLCRDISKYNYTDKNNKIQYMIVANNKAISIIDKINAVRNGSMANLVMPRRVFGIDSTFSDSLEKTIDKGLKVYCSNKRIEWTNIDTILSNKDIVDKWNVAVSKVSAESIGARYIDKYRVINESIILRPGEICSESYLIAGTFDNENEAINMLEYINTKIVRFLILSTLLSVNITCRNFLFVPLQDFSRHITDNDLIQKYGLSAEEYEIVLDTIK